LSQTAYLTLSIFCSVHIADYMLSIFKTVWLSPIWLYHRIYYKLYSIYRDGYSWSD